MTANKRVNVGIVGLGGRSEAWLKNCQMIKQCRVTALCDKIEALVQQKYKMVTDYDKEVNVGCYTDVDKMLKEADIDAVALVVAPEYNTDLICQCLEAGKHVIAEVPLCYTIEECWRIVLAVEKSGLKFQLGEQCRFAPWVQAWKQMVKDGTLGKILYVEGQYLHGLGTNRYWHDSKTGDRITAERAKEVPSHKSRFWNLIHPIHYMPHELSPLLSILNDRVVKVTGMATRPQSYRHDWYPRSDIEVALMHTEKDTILRLMAGFTIETCVGSEHCCRMIGVKGWVEQARTKGERDKKWLAEGLMANHEEVNLDRNAAWDMPRECMEMGIPFNAQAHASGHGGLDYYPMATFVHAIQNDTPTVMDVYKAVETATPAILAGRSIEEDNVYQMVPNFRPGKDRRAGCLPKK